MFTLLLDVEEYNWRLHFVLVFKIKVKIYVQVGINRTQNNISNSSSSHSSQSNCNKLVPHLYKYHLVLTENLWVDDQN